MQIRQRLDAIHAHPDFALALGVIETLGREGARTVFAGGGVRDALLGVPPKDLDLATSAHPDCVAGSFERTFDVGRAFGTIVVVEGERQLEVTTFRREGDYLDGRRPTTVEFTDEAEDAGRRDFTVNALFYDPLGETLLDYVDGLRDLGARRLRAVGDPRRRFREDHLRMLRAVRFVAQLGFDLDADTTTALRAEREGLRDVAAERILAEMKRLLESGPGRARGLKVARATGVLELIWPECDLGPADRAWTSWENAFAALTRATDAAGRDARLAAWKASNESRRRVRTQIAALEILNDGRAPLARRLRAWGGDWSDDVRALARTFVDPRGLAETENAFARIAPEGVLPRPYLDGAALVSLGVPRDKRLGRLLESLYDEQLTGSITSRDEAWARARNSINE